MIPWLLLDKTAIPGGGELRLMRRGDEFSIMLGTNELMNSRRSGSEEALATVACQRLGSRKAPHVLIGGLGMGFTLRAALGCLPPDASIDVVELVPGVVAWARTVMAELHGASLTDARVTIREADVAHVIETSRAAFDAILLDVDNGPDGLTRDANDALYSAEGLMRAHEALRGGGILAVWSSAPDARFTQRLRKARFAVDEVKVRANGRRGGARQMIWIATKA